MNILFLPMLISGIFCILLSIITWLFRNRDTINKMFSLFTLALAIDSFAFFAWFQFGRTEHINTWMRITFTAGFFVPITLLYFFFAFTGYDKKPDAKVLKIKVKHFKMVSLFGILMCIIFSQFTDLIIRISDNPKHIWDVEFGAIGSFLFPLFLIVFFYLFTMAYKSFKTAAEPQKRFILLLSIGTLIWLFVGYGGAIIFPTSNEKWQLINYIGTFLMAVFYFVAILNYQFDKVNELNIGLEQKVKDRTQELLQKNIELKDTLLKLQQMQKQVIVQEKMASLGQLVAGLTHEFNTPIGAVRSMNDTISKAIKKLETIMKNIVPETDRKDQEITKLMQIILNAEGSISQGTERLNEIIKNLKNFTRLDEAETVKANIHEGLDSVLALIKHEYLANITVVKEYGDIPEFIFQPRKMNQVFLNLIKNAGQAIEDEGQITITTSQQGDKVHIVIRDTGKGIAQTELDSIFDPGFTTKGPIVRARLGLSISYQIVQEHHGEIKVASEPGKGSTFTVVLPVDLNNQRTQQML